MLPRVVKGNEDSSIYSALPLVKINNPYIQKLILLVIDQRPIQRECYSNLISGSISYDTELLSCCSFGIATCLSLQLAIAFVKLE